MLRQAYTIDSYYFFSACLAVKYELLSKQERRNNNLQNKLSAFDTAVQVDLVNMKVFSIGK